MGNPNGGLAKGGLARKAPIGPKRAFFCSSLVVVGCGRIGPDRPQKGPAGDTPTFFMRILAKPGEISRTLASEITKPSFYKANYFACLQTGPHQCKQNCNTNYKCFGAIICDIYKDYCQKKGFKDHFVILSAKTAFHNSLFCGPLEFISKHMSKLWRFSRNFDHYPSKEPSRIKNTTGQ